MQSAEGDGKQIADVLRRWLGWCPSRPAGGARIPDMTDIYCSTGIPGPGFPPFRTIQIIPIVIPHWMTAISLIILFATCFVGGNFWWPAVVLVVLVIFTISLSLSYRASRGS